MEFLIPPSGATKRRDADDISLIMNMKDHAIANGRASVARVIVISLCLTFLSSTSHGQQALVDAVIEAERTYPELAIEGSPFHKAFLEEVAAARSANDPVLRSPQWPLEIAKRVAAFQVKSLAAGPGTR